MNAHSLRLWWFLVFFMTVSASAESRVLDSRLHHLRAEGPREWAEFPETAEAPRLEIDFSADANLTEQSLHLRQQDVKQSWTVQLNGKRLGELVRDENDMTVCFPVPAGGLVSGQNTLRIEPSARGRAVPDDVVVGEVVLDSRSVREALAEATLDVTVFEAETSRPLPARITILDRDGSLQTVWCDPNPELAVRPGTVYTATGRAKFQLPAGRYTLYAGRGFEYSLAQAELTVEAGESVRPTLTIRREVPTPGYIACDPHVHTRTHSGHGDASVEERMVTLAAEGIELAVASDHNVHIDHEPFARDIGVRRHFTPVIGNEVTTPTGHFTIFPVPADSPVPNHRLTDWNAVFEEIQHTTGAPIVILNHARDLHSGVRPFGPKLYNALVAESLDDRPLRFNAMEVVNSGAVQTDGLRLFQDWMFLLNRGLSVTPVGSSDSHDVARHFVGQGRTYIRYDDRDPGAVDVSEAVENFRRGRVRVSYGLLAELNVGEHDSGEVVPVTGQTVRVEARVLGPHWVQADRVELFANGRKIREQSITKADAKAPGVKWSGHWTLPMPAHDVHLVAIARGPGVDKSYWRTAKPYQPTSPQWRSQVFGCSGAVWLDVDRDGKATAARDYAERLWKASAGDLPKLLASLAEYDEAVAAHAAHLCHTNGRSLTETSTQIALRDAASTVQAGFREYLEAWRETQTAQSGVLK